MSKVAEQTPEQAPVQTPAQELPNIEQSFADDFTEEMIVQLFEGDKSGKGETPAAEGERPGIHESEGTQPTPEEEAKAEPPKEEPKSDEDDGKYVIPLFGKDVELEGTQVVELAEAGAQFIQHKPQIQQAMNLMQAVQQDPKLQAMLNAYANGQPIPMDIPQAPLAQPGSPEDQAILQFQQQIIQNMLPHVMRAVEEKYKPFVENVNSFAAEHRTEKAFSTYRADPEYSTVNDLMQRNIMDNVAAGKITHEQAAQIDHALKSDPRLYGDWFGKFKGAIARGKAGQAAGVAPAAGATRVVARAPKLEGNAAATETENEAIGQKWKSGNRSGAFASAMMQTLNK